ERILLRCLLERVVGRVLLDRSDVCRLPGQLLDLVVSLGDACSAHLYSLVGSLLCAAACSRRATALARLGSAPRSRQEARVFRISLQVTPPVPAVGVARRAPAVAEATVRAARPSAPPPSPSSTGALSPWRIRARWSR